MLPPDYRWERDSEREILYLDGVAPYAHRCAGFSPLPGGGGVLLHWGIRDMPKQRILATTEGARRFAEAWACKWDAEIRRVIVHKQHDPYDVRPPSPEVTKEAASRDHARRRGHNKNWWKEKSGQS